MNVITLAAVLQVLGVVFILVFGFSAIFQVFFPKGEKQATKTITYNDKIKMLTKSLNKASTDADQILEEMAKIIQERQTAVTILEQKQTELKRFIDSLEHGPAETLKIYQEIMEEQAKKQDREGRKLTRKYFIYGSVVTLIATGIGILITLYIHL